MSHFYGSIHGSRGEATRAGTKDSGYVAYAQGHGSRATTTLHHNNATGKDEMGIRIGPGYSTYSGGTLSIDFNDIDAVVQALAVGDRRIEAARKMIYDGIDKLNAEAPQALERAMRKRRAAERKEARKAQAAARMRQQICRDAKPEEKARMVRLIQGCELDERGNFTDESVLPMEICDVRYDDRGHIILSHPMRRDVGASFMIDFDVTDGIWLMPPSLTPEDLTINDKQLAGFGWTNKVNA